MKPEDQKRASDEQKAQNPGVQSEKKRTKPGDRMRPWRAKARLAVGSKAAVRRELRRPEIR